MDQSRIRPYAVGIEQETHREGRGGWKGTGISGEALVLLGSILAVFGSIFVYFHIFHPGALGAIFGQGGPKTEAIITETVAATTAINVRVEGPDRTTSITLEPEIPQEIEREFEELDELLNPKFGVEERNRTEIISGLAITASDVRGHAKVLQEEALMSDPFVDQFRINLSVHQEAAARLIDELNRFGPEGDESSALLAAVGPLEEQLEQWKTARETFKANPFAYRDLLDYPTNLDKGIARLQNLVRAEVTSDRIIENRKRRVRDAKFSTAIAGRLEEFKTQVNDLQTSQVDRAAVEAKIGRVRDLLLAYQKEREKELLDEIDRLRLEKRGHTFF